MWVAWVVIALLVFLVVAMAKRTSGYQTRLNESLAVQLKQQEEVVLLERLVEQTKAEALQRLQTQERAYLQRITALRQEVGRLGADNLKSAVSTRVSEQQFTNIIKMATEMLMADGVKPLKEFDVQSMEGRSGAERVLTCLLYYVARAEAHRVMSANERTKPETV